MWILENTKDSGTRFNLLVGKDYIVGRKDCMILIPNDSSVSRKHATLTVTHSEANLGKPGSRPVLTLADSSKFGSVRNGSKLAGGNSTPLEDGDSIVFGAMNSNQWRVTYTPMVVAFSSLPSADKKSLKASMLRLGGHVVPEWSGECTHLIMTQLTVTIKVIGALVTCRPVVTPAFLRKVEEAAVNNSQMPDAAKFQPVMAEAAINERDVSFRPNADRKTLFNGKTVIFLAQKQYKQLGQTVQLAGGRSVLADEGLTSTDTHLLTDPDTIVLYADPSDHSQVMTQAGQEWVVDVMNVLKRNGLRPIPQSEFGLAVLYASTDVHCNPKVAQAGLNLLHPVAAPSLPTQDVLASETQPSQLPGSRFRGKKADAGGSIKVATTSEKKQDTTGPGTSEQAPARKRMRDEGSCGVASPSKVPRREASQPSAKHRLETSPEIRATRAGPVPGASPELPFVGKPASRPQGNGRADRASMKDSEKIREKNMKESTSGKPDAETIARISHKNSETAKEDSPSHSKLSLEDDIIPSSAGVAAVKSKSTPHKTERQPLRSRPAVSVSDDAESAVPETLPDDDIAPPSGRDARDRRMGRRREEEDLFAMETEDADEEKGDARDRRMGRRRQEKDPFAIETEDADEEKGDARDRRMCKRREEKDPFAIEPEDGDEENAAEQSMWRRKTKKSRFIKKEHQEDEPLDDVSNMRHLPQDVPGGYITANKTIKSEQTSPQDPTLPCNLATVEVLPSAIRRPVVNGTHNTAGGKKAVQNFKKFKKASYAGQYTMPQIIGGSDLVHHGIGHIKEAEDMMEQERETIRKRHREKDMADRLFDWDPKPTKRRR